MSHCDPISHGTANSQRKEERKKKRALLRSGERKINKGGRKRGGRKRRQRSEKIKSRVTEEKLYGVEQHGGRAQQTEG